MTQPEQLQRLLDPVVAAGAPGAAAWVRDEDGSRYAAAGVADVASGRPMAAGLRFRAGSLTKSLVATVVLQLVAEGRVSLADPLERWLPGTLPYGATVTIRQLLNHTSGVPHEWTAIERTLYGSPEGRVRAWSPSELIALVARRTPSFRPGTSWSYSNTGYVLLGLIVEAAGGATLAHQVQRRIVEPLGLRATYLPGDDPELPEPMSRGYSLPLDAQGQARDGPLLDVTVLNPSWAWAAGGLVSSLEDLVAFFRALLHGLLLPDELLAQMRTTVSVPPGSIPLPLYDRYGLGLLEMPTPAGRLIGHAGGIPGYLSMVLSAPDGRRQFGVLANLLVAPDGVYEAFLGVLHALAAGAGTSS